MMADPADGPLPPDGRPTSADVGSDTHAQLHAALERLSYLEGQLSILLRWVDILTRSISETPRA
jgi:hypothetical protein